METFSVLLFKAKLIQLTISVQAVCAQAARAGTRRSEVGACPIPGASPRVSACPLRCRVQASPLLVGEEELKGAWTPVWGAPVQSTSPTARAVSGGFPSCSSCHSPHEGVYRCNVPRETSGMTLGCAEERIPGWAPTCKRTSV